MDAQACMSIFARCLLLLAGFLSLPALLICLLPLDAVFGYGIDSSGAMGGFLLFILFAPMATLVYLGAWYLGGVAYRRIVIICLSVLWGMPILVALLYLGFRPLLQLRAWLPNSATKRIHLAVIHPASLQLAGWLPAPPVAHLCCHARPYTATTQYEHRHS